MTIAPSTPPPTAAALHPLVAERWSPRSFDPAVRVSDESLHALLEAGRWAPSAMNRQPWRFVAGHRGDATFATIVASLAPGNQVWAGNAGALIVAFAEVADAEGTPITGTQYELGLAVAQLTVQAQAEGLHVHQMGGFSRDAVQREFAVPAGYEAVVALAVGQVAAPDRLPPALRERELAPRTRRPLSELAFTGSWGRPLPAAEPVRSAA